MADAARYTGWHSHPLTGDFIATVRANAVAFTELERFRTPREYEKIAKYNKKHMKKYLVLVRAPAPTSACAVKSVRNYLLELLRKLGISPAPAPNPVANDVPQLPAPANPVRHAGPPRPVIPAGNDRPAALPPGVVDPVGAAAPHPPRPANHAAGAPLHPGPAVNPAGGAALQLRPANPAGGAGLGPPPMNPVGGVQLPQGPLNPAGGVGVPLPPGLAHPVGGVGAVPQPPPAMVNLGGDVPPPPPRPMNPAAYVLPPPPPPPPQQTTMDGAANHNMNRVSFDVDGPFNLGSFNPHTGTVEKDASPRVSISNSMDSDSSGYRPPPPPPLPAPHRQPHVHRMVPQHQHQANPAGLHPQRRHQMNPMVPQHQHQMNPLWIHESQSRPQG